MLKDVKGKRLPAMKVISESIEYMREHLMRELKRVRQGHPVIRQSEIRWIVTVPATWSNAAKQFMREAEKVYKSIFTFAWVYFFLSLKIK